MLRQHHEFYGFCKFRAYEKSRQLLMRQSSNVKIWLRLSQKLTRDWEKSAFKASSHLNKIKWNSLDLKLCYLEIQCMLSVIFSFKSLKWEFMDLRQCYQIENFDLWKAFPTYFHFDYIVSKWAFFLITFNRSVVKVCVCFEDDINCVCFRAFATLFLFGSTLLCLILVRNFRLLIWNFSVFFIRNSINIEW